ncbi:MAG: hypothetical protein JWN14_488 [Chthonomonadales bacterium]|nr:hypothetical protein [Chthonomonadales bacterium]
MQGDLETVELRLAVPQDDERIVEIANSRESNSIPLAVERYRAEYSEEDQEHPGERYVAVQDGRIVGYGSFHWAWWTGDPGIYAATVCVDPSRRRQGIGIHLFHRLRERLQLRGAYRLTDWVGEDASDGRGFAAHLGFQETGQIVQDYLLKISEAEVSAVFPLKERLSRDGLRIASLSELPHEDPTFLRALQRLWTDSGDEPASPEERENAFDSWQQQTMHAAGLSPETHWIAMEGEHPVGTTFLKQVSADAYENDYTGVALSHRGRGIATALKLHAIEWAQQQGVTWFLTNSEINNHAMIAIHLRLGYRPGNRRVEVAGNL